MFSPVFSITPQIASDLMRIEAIKQEFVSLPLTPAVLSSLKETARLESIHYSTQIEGNRLTEHEVAQVIKKSAHIPGRERDQQEVLGYYIALEYVEHTAQEGTSITEHIIQKIHALLMSAGNRKAKPTPYRSGQNVIRDSASHAIVYLPPEAQDVPLLMHDFFEWLESPRLENFPLPLKAGIAHYQFATIHPYYDGNGRTARLLTMLILHKSGYSLKGIYSLDEYYAKNLPAYYEALDVSPSHNYYMGRAEADITRWLEYFCAGMVESFSKVRDQALKAAARNETDQSRELKKLNARQRKVLSLFETSATITAKDMEQLLHISARSARALCQQWTTEGFLELADTAKKSRKYNLGYIWQNCLNQACD